MKTKYKIGQKVYVNAGNLKKHGNKTTEVTVKRIMYAVLCETGDEEIQKSMPYRFLRLSLFYCL